MNRGVSVAEKRAMLEAAGEPWPVCDCHGKPKVWCKNVRRKSGGFWNCREAWRERHRRYNQSEKGHEAIRRYDQSEKGHEAGRRYIRKKSGIPLDSPIMPPTESGALGARIREIRRAVANKHTMNVIGKLDPRRAKLMRLAVDEGATPFERKRALEALRKHNHVLKEVVSGGNTDGSGQERRRLSLSHGDQLAVGAVQKEIA